VVSFHCSYCTPYVDVPAAYFRLIAVVLQTHSLLHTPYVNSETVDCDLTKGRKFLNLFGNLFDHLIAVNWHDIFLLGEYGSVAYVLLNVIVIVHANSGNALSTIALILSRMIRFSSEALMMGATNQWYFLL
jgi:hypothetical protein